MNRREFLTTLPQIWIALASQLPFSSSLFATLQQHPQDTSEYQEISKKAIAALTANAFLAFGKRQLGDKVEKHQATLYPTLYRIFSEHAFCSIQGGQVTFSLTPEQADELALALFPTFLEVYWGFVNWFIHTFKGSNEQIWREFIEQTKAEKDIAKSQKRYFGEFWLLFSYLDTALQKAAQAQHIACKGMSVGRYLAFITELFPNQTIKAYGENLSERELERPLEYLVSRSLSSKK